MRALIFAVLVPALLVAQAQRDNPIPAQTGQAAISGTVVSDDEAARPVRRAIVDVSGGGLRGAREAVTDDQGHFAIGGLPDGRYTLQARKGGWLPTYYGSTHPGRPVFGGANLAVKAGTPTQVTLRLLHGSAVSGTVSDIFGRPVANVQVNLVPARTTDAQRTLVAMGFAGSSNSTDDRGMFRLFGIAPGDYVLVATVFQNNAQGGRAIEQLTPESLAAARRSVSGGTAAAAASTAPEVAHGPTVTYAPIYYPGAIDSANAATITVGRNEERTGLDFALQLVRTSRIEGVVLGPDGQPVRGASVQLEETSDIPLQMFNVFSFTVSDLNGHFEFRGVKPGAYSTVARAADPAAAGPGRAGGVNTVTNVNGGVVSINYVGGLGQPLYATESVTAAGADVDGLTLRLQRGATVSGHAVFAGTANAPPDPKRIRIALEPVAEGRMAMFGNWTAMLDPSGAFQIANVPPGRYRVTAVLNIGRGGMAGVGGWLPRSAMVGPVDALDQPFEVSLAAAVPDVVLTFADHLAEIDGKVTNAAGRPVTDYRIVVIAADQGYWGTRNRRMLAPVGTDADGSFRVDNLPAGEYLLAAVTDMDPEDLTSKTFLTDLAAHALHVTVGEGEKKTQNLAVGGGR